MTSFVSSGSVKQAVCAIDDRLALEMPKRLARLATS